MSMYLTVDELAGRWRCSRAKIYRLMKSGQVRYMTVGSRRLVPVYTLLGMESGWERPK